MMEQLQLRLPQYIEVKDTFSPFTKQEFLIAHEEAYVDAVLSGKGKGCEGGLGYWNEGVPAYVAGVFRYRGVIVPVIDLSQLIGNTPAAARLSTRIILTRHVGANGQVHILGLRAEKATDIMASDASAPMPSGVVAAEAPYLGGLSQQGGALVQFINVLQLLPTAVRDSLFVES